MTLVAVDCHMVGQRAAGDAGNARYAANLVTAMAAGAAPGDQVAALVATPEGTRQMRDVAHRVAGVPAGDMARLARRASAVLSDMDADASVFTYVSPLFQPCPLLLAIHDATFVTNPEWLSPRARAVLRKLVPRSARRAGAILVLSDTARRDVVSALGVNPATVHVVSPYAEPSFTPDDGAVARVRERFGLEDYCLAVGDLGPRKNLAALGSAIAMLGDRAPRLALVGRPGPDGAAIVRESGGRWLGHVDDTALADLYRAAAVTAYPSLYEGFGLPALEAMACASPVVASNRGALPEVAGDAAILVDPTPAAIADGIRAALEPGESSRLRAAGPARAARYSMRQMGDAAWAAVRACAGAGAGGAR